MERIVLANGFEPFGTVGKYAASPQPPTQTMRDNVATADCIVIAATPRYWQRDVSSGGAARQAVSEMLVAEAAMAFFGRKPVMVFIQAGTDAGRFLPSITQYVEVDPFSQEHINAQWPLIQSYFRNATAVIAANWGEQRRKNTWDAVVATLAIIGACAAVYALAKSE